MKIVVQKQFGPPAALKTVRDEPLVIHQRTDQSDNRHLVVFVHGLGGSRYGKRSTWGSFPAYLFEDFPQLDIGLYSFRSALGRLKFWRSVPVPREAEVLADILRGMRKDGKYDWFIMVGHSLGGLLCKGAAAALADRSPRHAIDRISDLVLMATPQLGSLRVPGALRWLTPDSRVLRAHSDFIQRLINTFQSRFHCALDPPIDDKIHLRVWAVIAAADVWVDALSAGIGIGASQQLIVAGSHSEIVKPADKNAEAYRFVRDCLQRALKPPVQVFRSETCRPVRLDELDDLRQFASGFFSEPVSDLRLMEEWSTVCPDVFQIVERITKSQGRVRTDTVGYFCVLPLTLEAADDLKSGRLSVMTVAAEQMPRQGESVRAVYIGGVAGVDQASQGAALHFLQAHLHYLAQGKSIRVLARPVTEDGLDLVHGHSLQPVTAAFGNGLGIVHEGTIAGFGSQTKKTRRRRRKKN